MSTSWRRECYSNRHAALSSDSHKAVLKDAREWYGAASQSERGGPERLSRRREWHGAACQLEAEDRLSRKHKHDRIRRQNETDEQR